MPRMMRCNAELTIQVPGTTVRLELWPGLDVDVDRVLAPERDGRPAVTIALAIQGREDCFSEIPLTDRAGEAGPAKRKGAPATPAQE